MKKDHGDEVWVETFRHKKLGLLKIVGYEDGWIEIYHRSGKLLNAHYGGINDGLDNSK